MRGLRRDANLVRLVEVAEIADTIRPPSHLVGMTVRIEALDRLSQREAVDGPIPPSAKVEMRGLVSFGGMFGPRDALGLGLAAPLDKEIARFRADRLGFDGAALEPFSPVAGDLERAFFLRMADLKLNTGGKDEIRGRAEVP